MSLEGKDVVLEKDEYSFFESNMTVLSKAIIPTNTKHLGLYIGRINPGTVTHVINLLNEEDMGYDNVAEEFVDQTIKILTEITISSVNNKGGLI